MIVMTFITVHQPVHVYMDCINDISVHRVFTEIRSEQNRTLLPQAKYLCGLPE